MGVKLGKMSENEYLEWQKGSRASYAESLFMAGGISREESLERADQSFATLLPQGFQTVDHLFYAISVEGQTEPVGMLWVHLRRSTIPSAFIYEFEVIPSMRGQGIGRKALRELEPMMRDAGAKSIALHVFAHNKGARLLYASSGYYETNVNMRKDL